MTLCCTRSMPVYVLLVLQVVVVVQYSTGLLEVSAGKLTSKAMDYYYKPEVSAI